MPPQTQRRRRTGGQNTQAASGASRARRADDSDEPESSEEDQGGDVDMNQSGDNTDEQLVKKLVRYALACEYARVPIRRDDIREKVLGTNARSFKRVFDGAQSQLRSVFGMEMIELPVKEKRTLREKQKATARGASQSTAPSRAYILSSTLPPAYRSQPILAPSRAPSSKEEAEYIGIYTFLISLIVLSGGELSDSKLKRHLNRMNASQNLPMDKTEIVLAKLVRQGYLDKIVEKQNDGDDNVSWAIGSRGKIEVTPAVIKGFVTEVWGEVPEDFEEKISKSLGMQIRNEDGEEMEVEEEAGNQEA